MPEFICNTKDEFFISIAKQGVHSFMMLGVVKEDGSSQLIARVGKQAGKASIKLISGGELAKLTGEPITGGFGIKTEINYQAYAINYKQVIEFLALIAIIDEKQLENEALKEAIIRADGNTERLAIKCYVPTDKKEDGTVSFTYMKLSECNFHTEHKDSSTLAQGAQQLQISNTCRHTSLNMVEAILGFVPDVSKYFFVSPKYQTTLINRQPDASTFYVLPSPPTAFDKEDLGKKQLSTLNKLYKRMEKIPLSNLNDPKTRSKFNELKATYNDIAGENNLTASDVLEKIMRHQETNKDALFAKRSPLLNNTLFLSTTEKMFHEITKDLKTKVKSHP